MPLWWTILERFPVTLTLAILGMIFAIAIGLPWGILAALKHLGGRPGELLRPRWVLHPGTSGWG
ncbi:hypothetical protein MASR2M79_22090 [Aminivibrio sp.]